MPSAERRRPVRVSRAMMALVVLFFAISILPLPMVPRLVANDSIASAAQLIVGFAAKGVAAVLLFTGDSRGWFSHAA